MAATNHFEIKEIGPFEETLRYLRVVIEPLFIFHNIWPYDQIEGVEFRSRILNWREPSIDSALYKLAILRELDPERKLYFSSDEKLEIIDFIQSLYDENSGAYKQTYKAEPSIYASTMAMALIKQLYNINWYRDPLGFDRALSTLGESGSLILKRVIDFVLNKQGNDGGFSENLNVPSSSKSSIRTTNAAYFLLWNLERAEEVKLHIRQYLFGRTKFLDSDGKAMAFVKHTDDTPSSASTYYALKMLKHMGEDEWIEEHKVEFLNFLDLCWDEDRDFAGFGIQHSSPRTLSSTVYVMRVFLEVFNDFDRVISKYNINKIAAYFRECQSMSGGIKFQERPGLEDFGLKWYSPNLYMTLHSIEFINKLNMTNSFSHLKPIKDGIAEFRKEYIDQFSSSKTPCYEIGNPPKRIEKILRIFRVVMDKLFFPESIALTRTIVPYIVVGAIFLLLIIFLLWLHSLAYINQIELIVLLSGPFAIELGVTISIIRSKKYHQ